MFKKAERRGQKIKFAITGPSGSGKTTAAIKMARGLVGPGGRIAIIDTENGSASLYADLEDFDACDLVPPYEQRKFSEAITNAEDSGYDVLIIDSFSHVWEAILAYKDKLDCRGGNSFTNWNQAGREFKSVLDKILHSEIHIICCMRAKMEHVIQDVGGKRTVKKVGLAPVMRDGIEFEFTVVFDLDMQHYAAASKDRTTLFDGKINMLSEETGELLRDWLDGASPGEVSERAPVVLPPVSDEDEVPMDFGEPATFEQVKKIDAYWKALKKPEKAKAKAIEWVGNSKATGFGGLTAAQAGKLIAHLQGEMNKLAKTQSTAKPGSGFEPPPPPTGISQDIGDWLAPHEEQVNSYLIEIKWLKPGQTWRDLSPNNAAIIKSKTESFALNCGIPVLEGPAA